MRLCWWSCTALTCYIGIQKSSRKRRSPTPRWVEFLITFVLLHIIHFCDLSTMHCTPQKWTWLDVSDWLRHGYTDWRYYWRKHSSVCDHLERRLTLSLSLSPSRFYPISSYLHLLSFPSIQSTSFSAVSHFIISCASLICQTNWSILCPSFLVIKFS